MRIKRIILIISIAVPLFILLMLGAFFLSVSDDEEESLTYGTSQELPEKVRKYAVQVGEVSEKYGIGDYSRYLLAIMAVESGGEGNDVMQSLGQSGMPEADKTPGKSIEKACEYFAALLKKAEEKGCDIDTVVQAYNYGADYIDHIAARGKKHTFSLAVGYARTKSGGVKAAYDNPVAVEKNGGWRYDYGNMFYVYLVKEYLNAGELPTDTVSAILAEAFKYEGWNYVWGGSDPSTSFDCSGLVQWCYGQAGITLPRTAQEQYDAMQHLTAEEAKPGDLVFFTKTYQTENDITHVGIYVGDGKMFHAGNPIGYADLNTAYWKEHFVCIGRAKQTVGSE